MLVISGKDKRIHYLSQPYCGSVHDYAMLNEELDPTEPFWFSDHDLYVDLGFLGVAKDYVTERLKIPLRRKSRRSRKDPKIPFTEAQKEHNTAVSRERIYVENAIGGMKRYWWLTHRLRCRDAQYYSLIAGVAAGLWNYQLKA